MNLPQVIQISTIQSIIGIVAILIVVGGAWGTLRTLVKGVKDDLDKEIKPDLKNIRERFGKVEDRVETLWQDKFAPAHSPRQLNELGKKILNESGIKKIIEDKKDSLLVEIIDKKPTNAYDAEQAILSVVAELPKYFPNILDQLKQGAFNVGQNLDTVLLVGGLHLRDLVFNELGFSLNDLDKPKT